MPDAALIFAAGFGTRMHPLTLERPKPLIEVAGKPLLNHARDLCDRAGLARVVVNTHYLHDQIATFLTDTGVAVSHETPEILDTGGGLRQALPLLGETPVFTLNSDAVWRGPNPLDLLNDAWDPDRMDALLMCVPKAQTVGHPGKGDFDIASDGQLIRGGTQVYAGVQIINPVGLDKIEQNSFSLNLLWNQMAQRGRLCGISYPGNWADVGHPGGIALAEDMVRDV